MEHRYYVVFIILILTIVGMFFVSKTKRQSTKRVVYLIYIIVVILFTLLMRRYVADTKFLLNPFRKYIALKKGLSVNGWQSLMNNEKSISEILLNVLLFVPFGFLTPLSTERLQKWWKVLFLGLCFSLFIELLQVSLHRGYFDIGDLMHNTIGTIIGFLVWCNWIGRRTTIQEDDSFLSE